MDDKKTIKLIDEFILLLNQSIEKDDASFHNYYEWDSPMDVSNSIVIINDAAPNEEIEHPLDYLVSKYIFQNSSYRFFVGYNNLTENKLLPLIRFGFCEDSVFAFCYNFQTEEIVIVFEETNEVYEYCAPNLYVFFELLIAFLPHLSSFDGIMAEKNGTYSRLERLRLAESIIQQFNLDKKYQHYVIHTLAGEDF